MRDWAGGMRPLRWCNFRWLDVLMIRPLFGQRNLRCGVGPGGCWDLNRISLNNERLLNRYGSYPLRFLLC